MLKRSIQPLIEEWLFKKKILIIYGPRQVGKTTLSNSIIEKYKDRSLYINCETLEAKEVLESQSPNRIRSYFNGRDIIVLDEAQQIRDIGRTLKLMIDTYPDIQIIATGSSSFELSNKINEPLTGRNIKFQLYPLSLKEINEKYPIPVLSGKLENILRFGLYPEVFDQPDFEARRILGEIANDYLFKDILSLADIKKPEALIQILKALAFQLGNEVSYGEISKTTNINIDTVRRYIDLLEKCFIIFKLPSYSNNMRNELKRGFKVYFYDLGIRNSIIQSFNYIENRNDIGALFENFCIIERVKQIQANKEYGNLYFWRSYTPDKEIDFVEERDGMLHAFEFKWSSKASRNERLPKNFLENYGGVVDENGTPKNITFKVIDNSNWWEWLI